MDAIVKFSDVWFSYSGMPVLKNVSFEVHSLESVCIVGPNGGGKSTLLKLMLGLLSPQSGTIEVLGTTASNARGRIGYVPQHLQYDTGFPVTVLDVVLMGRLEGKIFGFYTRKDRKMALSALEKMGVADMAARSFNAISGGQRQRVLIARALACAPAILLLDEPTASVDPAAGSQFEDNLKALIKEMTIITVSHDLGFVTEMVDHVICVNQVVRIHPTSALTGDVIREIYGSDQRLVRHDHCCAEGGHHHG